MHNIHLPRYFVTDRGFPWDSVGQRTLGASDIFFPNPAVKEKVLLSR